MKCIPDKIFTYDHNVCYCNENGTEVTCKRKMFTTLTPELHRIQFQNITVKCEPNETFKDICRDCICHESGNYASCLGRKCPRAEAKLETRDKCTPGSVFSDRCNGCICGSNGTAVCTKLDCRQFSTNTNETQCVPNSFLMLQCNECQCSENGKSMDCNRMGCESFSFHHSHILNMTITCDPTTIFQYNCHHCHCGETGKFAMCSGIACPHEHDMTTVLDTVDNCNPGVIFADDCNVCVCGDDKRGVCTTFTCDLKYGFKYVDNLNLASH
ncbi:tenascin-like [Trichogramma pretiosum]|uniref:tenascin-like n=1 Tax=Trichogramma pretiosum TaxID=7493 RepID=UPI000C7199EA|nr:tenascin-like [Trichogramma pretiosum]